MANQNPCKTIHDKMMFFRARSDTFNTAGDVINGFVNFTMAEEQFAELTHCYLKEQGEIIKEQGEIIKEQREIIKERREIIKEQREIIRKLS